MIAGRPMEFGDCAPLYGDRAKNCANAVYHPFALPRGPATMLRESGEKRCEPELPGECSRSGHRRLVWRQFLRRRPSAVAVGFLPPRFGRGLP